jgi:AAHS family 4-hydroxybenzoate transporter-like MFS transporter
VFYVGGAMPLVIGAAMWLALPESMQYLTLKRKRLEDVGRWLRRISPTAPSPAEADYVVAEEQGSGVPIVQLFHGGRAPATALLWIVMFMNLLNIYFLATWLPTIAREMGFGTSAAVLVGTTLQVGGTIGAFVLGPPIRRFGFFGVLALTFVAAAASIAAIGQSPAAALLFGVVFVAGFGVLGGQAALNALAASFYPTALRATGVGAASGIGRTGSVLGPLLAEIMRSRWSTEQLFLAAAVPALISAVAIVSLRPAMRRTQNPALHNAEPWHADHADTKIRT